MPRRKEGKSGIRGLELAGEQGARRDVRHVLPPDDYIVSVRGGPVLPRPHHVEMDELESAPKEAAAAAEDADLSDVPIPSCDAAEKEIKTGSDARCFAQYMRIHALEASGGNTYAQMGRFVAAADPSDPKGHQ